jgi:TPR repeat protein
MKKYSLFAISILFFISCKSNGEKCLVAVPDSDVNACEKACKSSEKEHDQYLSCERLGVLYERGIKVTKDLKKAKSYYAKGCRLSKSSIICDRLRELKN